MTDLKKQVLSQLNKNSSGVHYNEDGSVQRNSNVEDGIEMSDNIPGGGRRPSGGHISRNKKMFDLQLPGKDLIAKMGDLSAPKAVSFIFFGSGDKVFIPIFWALMMLAFFIVLCMRISSVNTTKFAAIFTYICAVLTAIFANLYFGYTLGPKVIEFTLKRAYAENLNIKELGNTLDLAIVAALIFALVAVILRCIVFSYNAGLYLSMELFSSLLFYCTHGFLTAIWMWLLYAKSSSMDGYVLNHVHPVPLRNGAAKMIVLEHFQDLHVTSMFWNTNQVIRLVTGAIYVTFNLFQFFSLYFGNDTEFLSFSDNSRQTYAFLLLTETLIFFGFMSFTLLWTGRCNQTLYQTLFQELALVNMYFDGSSMADPVVERERHTLLMELSVYQHHYGAEIMNRIWGVWDAAALLGSFLFVSMLFAYLANSGCNVQ